jgi:hypothetical protein
MTRSRPPRKVTYFEPVPPRLARSLAVSPPLDRDDHSPRRSLRRSTLQSAFAWAMKSAGLGIVSNRPVEDNGARPEVGWVPLAMDEPSVPWQLRGTLH